MKERLVERIRKQVKMKKQMLRANKSRMKVRTREENTSRYKRIIFYTFERQLSLN